MKCSSETKARLDSLVAIAQNDTSRLGELHHQVNVLRQGIPVSSLSPTAQTQLRSLFDLSDHARDLIVQNRIIDILAFDGMHGRYEAVDDAHYQTFRWIFGSESSRSPSASGSDGGSDAGSARSLHQRIQGLEDEEAGASDSDSDCSSSSVGPKRIDDTLVFRPGRIQTQEAPDKVSARIRLLDWLSTGTGIFHISGKLGSGKSTLMKFLCEHESTRNRLEQWAGLISRLSRDGMMEWL